MTVEKLYSWKVPECKEDREQRWTDTRNKLSVMWEGKCSFSYEMSLSLKSESHPNKSRSSACLSLLEALENVLTSLLCSDQRDVSMQNKLIVTVQNHQTHSHASLPLPALTKIFAWYFVCTKFKLTQKSQGWAKTCKVNCLSWGKRVHE